MFHNVSFCIYQKQDNWIQKIHPYLIMLSFMTLSIMILLTPFLLGQILYFLFFIGICITNHKSIFSYIRFYWKLKWLLLGIGGLYFFLSFPLSLCLVAILKLLNITNDARFLLENTKFKDLLSFLEEILHPLRVVGIPIEEVILMLALAMHFLPLIVEKGNQILKSSENRGIMYQHLSIPDKILYVKQCFFPLFIGTIKLSDKVADVLTVKTYAFSSDTESWKFKDAVLLVLLLYFFLGFLLWRYVYAV